MPKVVVHATEWWPVVDVIVDWADDGYGESDTCDVPVEVLAEYEEARARFHAAEELVLQHYPGGSKEFYRF